jgi:hypothetical protein
VWICRDVLGGMTFTFNPRLGMVGGVPVPRVARPPRAAAQDRRRRAEVLTGFGLTDEEARDPQAAKNGHNRCCGFKTCSVDGNAVRSR